MSLKKQQMDLIPNNKMIHLCHNEKQSHLDLFIGASLNSSQEKQIGKHKFTSVNMQNISN